MANGNGKHLKRVRIDDLLTFSPITKNQEKTLNLFKVVKINTSRYCRNRQNIYVIILALEEVLDKSSVVNDIFIVRSVVSTRDIGFLPGDEQEKYLYTKLLQINGGEFFNVETLMTH